MGSRPDKDIALNYMTEHEYDILHGEETELPALKVNPTPNILQFNDQNGKMIGRLFMRNGKLDFEGNAYESALVLFEAFKEHVREQLMEKEDAT